MKKKILLTVLGVLLISVYLFAQSYVTRSVITDPYGNEDVTYVTHKDGKKNGFTQTIHGSIYPYLTLDYYEKDSLLLSMLFDNATLQILSIFKDIEVNNSIYPRPDPEAGEVDKYYNHKCNVIFFHSWTGTYESSGIYLFDDYDFGNGTEYHDRDYDGWDYELESGSAAEHLKEETTSYTHYINILDGKLHGSQVYFNKSTGAAWKILFYEHGVLKAEFLFNEDASIRFIAKDIEDNDLSDDFIKKCTLISFQPDGERIGESILLFNDFPDDSRTSIY